MTVGWVAPVMRGQALERRTVGREWAAELAGAERWIDARSKLATTAYGAELPVDADRRAARNAAMALSAWQFRVLAGWMPAGRAGLVRLAAAPLEIDNIEQHLARLAGAETSPPLRLGSLGVAWPQVAAASSIEQVRAVLRRSAWGDVGEDPREIAVGLRVAWARRAVRLERVTRPWALGSLAVLIARERLAFGREMGGASEATLRELFGSGWRRCSSVDDLRSALPDVARWPLDGISEPSELWRAEAALVGRVAADAQRLAERRTFDAARLVGLLGLLVVDLRRVLAAVEVAGSGRAGAEAFDAVA